MEQQQEFQNLVSHLENHALVQAPSEIWQDRVSGILRVRAVFDNGTTITVDIADRAQITEVKSLFQANLKKVFAKTSEFRDLLKLESGKRYTVILESEMGFGVHASQFTLNQVQVGRYAQYDNCIELVLTPKRKRNLHSIKFYGRKNFALYEGWIDVNTNPWSKPEDQGLVVVTKMKYASCDDRFLTDAIASVKVAPLYSKRFGGAQ